MAPGVPGDGGDTVAELDAVALQHLRTLQGVLVNFGVIGPDDGAFDRARHDLLRAVIGRGVLDDPVAEQGPVLHQTKHLNSLLACYLLVPSRVGSRGKGDQTWN